jgi:HSP20 family protein
MALVKWEGLRDIENLLERYTGALGWPAARAGSMLGLGDWNPRVDISETDDSYLIKADVPGVAKDDLKLSVEDGVLTVQGERHQEQREENRRYHRIERSYGSFSRSFTLPADADAAAVKAVAADGQLTVTVAKKPSAPSTGATQVPVE